MNQLKSAVFVFLTILYPTTILAQDACETVLECAQKALEEATKAREMVEEMTKIKQEINTTLSSYNKILASENIPNLGASKKITFKLDRPGILFATATAENKEGRAGGSGQHTIQAIVWIDINGTRCAIDQAAYFVYNGSAFANASCTYQLRAGDHEIVLGHNSTYAGTTRAYGNFQVIQATK